LATVQVQRSKWPAWPPWTKPENVGKPGSIGGGQAQIIPVATPSATVNYPISRTPLMVKRALLSFYATQANIGGWYFISSDQSAPAGFPLICSTPGANGVQGQQPTQSIMEIHDADLSLFFVNAQGGAQAPTVLYCYYESAVPVLPTTAVSIQSTVETTTQRSGSVATPPAPSPTPAPTVSHGGGSPGGNIGV
jgi:hypothetical protein